MSNISINTGALEDKESRLKGLSKRVNTIQNSLGILRWEIDSDIKGRQNIDRCMSNLYSDLGELERRLNDAANIVEEARKRYDSAEKELERKISNLTDGPKPHKGWFSSFLDRVKSLITKRVEKVLDIMALLGIFGPVPQLISSINHLKDFFDKKNNKPIDQGVTTRKNETKIPPFKGTLSYNPHAHNPEVALLQKRLNELGYSLKVDGYFGEKTLAAVNDYKNKNKLWNTGEYAGKVGETTWKHIFLNLLAPYKPDVAPSGNGTAKNPASSADVWRQNIIENAKFWVGKIPYCRNTKISTQVLDKNNPPPYMDCSDFTSSVYKTILGIDIGPNTSTQKDRGTPVNLKDIKPGDLILFDWDNDGDTHHVGIYIGNGQFIDEHGDITDPKKINADKYNVRIATLNDYYKSHIHCIRRIIQDDDTYVNIKPTPVPLIPGTKTNKPSAKPSGNGITSGQEGKTGDKSNIGSIAEFKKKYGNLIDRKAKELGVAPNVLASVIIVESSGSGFVDGKLKIRFENHQYVDRVGHKDLFTWGSPRWKGHKFRKSKDEPWQTVHTGDQKSENAAFEFAKTLNEEAAYESISMGMGQIMGFNHQAAGYESAKAMFQDFSKGNEHQINGMCTFFENYNGGKTLKAMQNEDFRSFVTQYNGDGQVDAYTSKLKNAIETYKKTK